jgi:hypothetical protein
MAFFTFLCRRRITNWPGGPQKLCDLVIGLDLTAQEIWTLSREARAAQLRRLHNETLTDLREQCEY